MKIYLFWLLAFASSIAFFSTDALACACCAERGTYLINTKRPTKYELDELKRIRFATANLYVTAAGEEVIEGISPISETYSLVGSLAGNLWKFDIRDQAAKSGTLNLSKPVSMTAFAADIHDRATGEVNLYKEWRFKYRVASGTGIFKTGIAPATEYFLVLQGRGNGCTSAEDFKNWRLEINGKRASYAFYGDLNTPE